MHPLDNLFCQFDPGRYGDVKRYIDSFCKDDYALFYSKGRGIIAVGQIITDAPTEVADEKYHSVRMIVPEKFNGDVRALPALSPNEIKTILKRNFYWTSTIKTPFLTGAQVEMLIRELKKRHVAKKKKLTKAERKEARLR